MPGVEYSCADTIGELAQITPPNDPEFPLQWWAWNTGQVVEGVPGVVGADVCLPHAWRIRHDATPVIVAVIDSGVNYLKADLAQNMWINAAEANGLPSVDDDGNGIKDDAHGAAFTKANHANPECAQYGQPNYCDPEAGYCAIPVCDYGPHDPFDIESGMFGDVRQMLCPQKDASWPGGHGTACAQIIGTVGNNAFGMTGVA